MPVNNKIEKCLKPKFKDFQDYQRRLSCKN